MMLKLRFRILMALFWTSVFVNADTIKPFHQYVLDSWSIEQGLPQITVNAITQDAEGYIWIGTQAGVARFDGVKFTTFSADNTEAIKGNYIDALFRDSKQRLWIGTYKGLVLYQNRQFHFIDLAIRNNKDTLQSLNVQSIGETSQGKILVGAVEGLFEVTDYGLQPYHGISQSIYSIAQQNNTSYVGSKGVLFELNNEVASEIMLPEGHEQTTINRLVWDKKKLWIATNKGLFTFKNNIISEYKTDSALYQFPVDELYLDSNEILWSGTIDGLFRIRDDVVVEHVTNENSRAFQQIISIYEDHEKNMWLGSYLNGLARIWPGRIMRYAEEEGLAESLTWAVALDNDQKSIWTGTNRGLFILKNGMFEKVISASDLPHPTAYTLLVEPDKVWIGTRKGVAIYKNDKVIIPEYLTDISGLQISSIFKDNIGAVYFGTAIGIFRYQDQQLIKLETEDRNKFFVRPIIQLKDGTVLLGSQKGLFKVQDDSLVQVGIGNGLSDDMDISSIFELENGFIIMTTISRGLFFFANGTWHNFTESDGLPVNESFTVNADDLGNIWISGYKGLYRVSLEDLIALKDKRIKKIKAYMFLSESGGIIGSQKTFCCNGAGNAKGFFFNGNLWYPTRGGIIQLDTHSIVLNPTIPNVVIERIRYGGVWRIIKNNDVLSLNEDQRDILVDFTALSFRDPKSVLFKYRLEGFHSDWREPDNANQRNINYTNLPPGAYSFQVVASNNAGKWNPDVTELNFTVSAKFYESLWFYIIVAISSLLIVFYWHRHRVYNLNQNKIELESEIQKHTEQLEISNQKLFEAVEALKVTSQTDQLTGLKNRRYLANQLPADLAHYHREILTKHAGETMIFAIADIDHFKHINDTYGHKAGDEVICQFSAILKRQVREGDYVIRWGGEEFILVFRSMPRDIAPDIINRIRAIIERNEFVIQNQERIHITCSIGFAEYPFFTQHPDLINWEHTIELADHALYTVKENNRNGWASFRATANTPHSKDLLFKVKRNLNEEIKEDRIEHLASWKNNSVDIFN